MRRVAAVLAWALAVGMSGCGGGGGAPTEPAPTPQLRLSAATDDASRAPGGVVHLHRVELRNTGNASARAVVVSVSPDAQALQLPLSCETAGCTPRNDGGVDIAEIPAGATVVLRQQLRVKPAYRGAVRNVWQAGATGASTIWRQELTAYVVDLAVTVDVPAGAATSPPSTSTYEVTLSNLGPDDAADVSWNLLTLPGQTWRIAGCTANTGSNCPTALGEAMTLARLPAGGMLKLQVQVDEPDTYREGLGSRADAAGDANPANNEAVNGQSAAYQLFMSDLEGRHYRLTLGVLDTLRAMAAGVDYRAPFHINVTGTGFLGAYVSTNAPWSRGIVNMVGGPFVVLGLDIGGVRKPYLAPRRLVTQLSELEGFSFNVLGSRSDASGKPQDAYVGSALFKDGGLQLCLPDAPTPFEQCPAARLTRFEAALVGSEIELVSRDRVVRLRAAASPDGPVLVSSSRDAATGASEFWMALPAKALHAFTSYDDELHETTFESASGQSTASNGFVRSSSDNLPYIDLPLGMPPTSALQYLQQTGTLGLCGLSAQLSGSAQPGVFQGVLRGDWLPGAFSNGQFVKERLCFAGTVHHVQTMNMAVFLGARGGDLMGRWMFVSN